LTIDEVRVQIGPLSGVEPILLANAFADLAAEGVVANVRLTLEPIEFVVRCDACGKTTASSEPQFRCRACGGLRVAVMQGDGLVLESVSLMQSVAEPAGEGARRA
jgi:hydrogenase nickel incorporation protein HypA/HybF